MSTTTMEIVQLTDDNGSGHSYYTKGHVDPQEFVRVLEEEWGPDVAAHKVEHVHLHRRPALPAETYEYGWHFVVTDSVKGKRGAFPATRVMV